MPHGDDRAIATSRVVGFGAGRREDLLVELAYPRHQGIVGFHQREIGRSEEGHRRHPCSEVSVSIRDGFQKVIDDDIPTASREPAHDLNTQLLQKRIRSVEPSGRVVVAADDDDVHVGIAAPASREKPVPELLGLRGEIGRVEDVSTHRRASASRSWIVSTASRGRPRVHRGDPPRGVCDPDASRRCESGALGDGHLSLSPFGPSQGIRKERKP